MKHKKIEMFFSIHYSFIILMVFAWFVGLLNLLILYFICLLLHELVHWYVAKKRGYKIGKIKLLATGAVLEAESDEFNFNDEIIIAISGPLFNLCFAILILACWWIYPESYNYSQDLLVINLAIFSFNMLPVFPLDGGRILLAFLSKKCERKEAVRITKFIAIILSFLLFFLFIISLFNKPNFTLAIASINMFIGSITEDKKAVYKKLLYLPRKIERTKKSGVEIRYILVGYQTEKIKLFKMLNARFYTIFILVDNNLKQVGIIQESELINSFSSF